METNCKFNERLELCKDILKIIHEGKQKMLSSDEILWRIETTLEVIKTFCECYEEKFSKKY